MLQNRAQAETQNPRESEHTMPSPQGQGSTQVPSSRQTGSPHPRPGQAPSEPQDPTQTPPRQNPSEQDRSGPQTPHKVPGSGAQISPVDPPWEAEPPVSSELVDPEDPPEDEEPPPDPPLVVGEGSSVEENEAPEEELEDDVLPLPDSPSGRGQAVRSRKGIRYFLVMGGST